MASVRQLKNTINTLIDEVLIDCLLAIHFNPSKEKAINPLMDEAMELRVDLIRRANHPEDKDTKMPTHQYFNAIRNDMFTAVDKILNNLCSVNK